MKKNIHYITYNDTYSGIYQSQVIDVVKHLNQNFDVSVKLIAFVPVRLWKEQKKVIKSMLPQATVFPILGSLDQVKRTSNLFRFIREKKSAICRGPLAFCAAQDYFDKVVYDGRAAVEAEVKEYNVAGNEKLNQLFIDAEKIAITKANYFISVSQKLIEYWESKLEKPISNEKYSIIPCTLTSQQNSIDNDVVSKNVKVVYAGGTGAWQSFGKVVGLLDELMDKQKDLEVLFLTKENADLTKLIEKYPNRCQRKWVAHNQVYQELSSCDYGILLRDDMVTNKVASPVKFAEYLNAGLKVLISPNIGDFSRFSIQYNCGLIIEDELPLLSKVLPEEKKHFKKLCQQQFYKKAPIIEKAYTQLLSDL